jgi:hypothetical protein
LAAYPLAVYEVIKHRQKNLGARFWELGGCVTANV